MESRVKTPHELLLVNGLAKITNDPIVPGAWSDAGWRRLAAFPVRWTSRFVVREISCGRRWRKRKHNAKLFDAARCNVPVAESNIRCAPRGWRGVHLERK